MDPSNPQTRAWRCHQTMAAFGQIAALVPLAICGDICVETNEEFQLQALEVKLSVSKLTDATCFR